MSYPTKASHAPRRAGAPLPLDVVLALLRVLRRKPAWPDDEDVLFDEFGCEGREQVLGKACARLLIEPDLIRTSKARTTYTVRLEERNAALDALLVDMLRMHYAARREAA